MMTTAQIVGADLTDRQGKMGHDNADGGLNMKRNGIATAGEACKPAKRCHLAIGVREESLIEGGGG